MVRMHRQQCYLAGCLHLGHAIEWLKRDQKQVVEMEPGSFRGHRFLQNAFAYAEQEYVSVWPQNPCYFNQDFCPTDVTQGSREHCDECAIWDTQRSPPRIVTFPHWKRRFINPVGYHGKVV